MANAVLSALIVLGLLQIGLWLAMELDVRRRGHGEATTLALGGIVLPFLGVLVSLWYFLDRERFLERASPLAPDDNNG